MRSHDGPAERSLPRVIPERIKEAREARGLTPRDFAERLDVTPQAVAQFETGQISPSAETMSKIIEATAQPPRFFTTTTRRPSDAPVAFWRSLKRVELHHRRRVTRWLEWAFDVHQYLEQFIEFPVIDLPSIEFDPEFGDAEEIERAAAKVRDHWGMGRAPIRGLTTLMEGRGVVLLKQDVGCPDMDAVSCWLGGHPFVIYSSRVESGPRTVFNLAHELGHIVLHAGVEVTTESLGAIEKQANRFAAAFLMPRETFPAEVFGTSLEHLLALKRRWGVAISAMAYRCRDLGLYNQDQFAYVMKQMNVRGVRKVEPLDDCFQSPEPTILADSMAMLLDNGIQNTDQIEAALGMNLADVERLCGLPRGRLDNRVVVPFRPRPRPTSGSAD